MAEPYVGEIKIFGFGFVPRGYVACDGRLLPIQQYAALAALLGTQYGGDGRQNVGVPDLRGRTPMHFAPNASIPMGQSGGVENVTLDQTQIPPHTHQLMGSSATATQRPATNGAFAKDVSAVVDFFAPVDPSQTQDLVALAPQSLAAAGGSQPHNNLQPYQVVNFCIAVLGYFPSRN